jgi:AmiR/NasT family two-component response regulator
MLSNGPAAVEREVAMAKTDSRSNRIGRAVGIVSAQTNCTVDEALLYMQERARRASRTLEEIAIAVVDRRVRFR